MAVSVGSPQLSPLLAHTDRHNQLETRCVICHSTHLANIVSLHILCRCLVGVWPLAMIRTPVSPNQERTQREPETVPLALPQSAARNDKCTICARRPHPGHVFAPFVCTTGFATQLFDYHTPPAFPFYAIWQSPLPSYRHYQRNSPQQPPPTTTPAAAATAAALVTNIVFVNLLQKKKHKQNKGQAPSTGRRRTSFNTISPAQCLHNSNTILTRLEPNFAPLG